MNCKDCIDKVRAKTETGSYYAAAKVLGVSEETLRGWKNGTRNPDPFSCLRIAAVLETPLEKIIACVQLEREKDPIKRKAWRDYLRSIKQQ